MCSTVKEIILLAFVKKMIYLFFVLRALLAVQPAAPALTAANRSSAKKLYEHSSLLRHRVRPFAGFCSS